jgi:hypothetical protein
LDSLAIARGGSCHELARERRRAGSLPFEQQQLGLEQIRFQLELATLKARAIAIQRAPGRDRILLAQIDPRSLE